MKIAYCLDSISAMGGIERVTLAKANALAAIETNTVYLLVTRNQGMPVFPLHPRIQVCDLHVNYGGDYGKSRWEAYRILWEKRREHRRKLTEALDKIQPDVLVSTNLSERFFIRSLSLKVSPVLIKEIHFSTDYKIIEAQGWKEKLMAYLSYFKDFRWKTKAFSQILILTEEDRERNWRNYSRVSVIPNPLTNNTSLSPSLLTEKRVIAAGRLVRQKNFASLIRAWKEVQAKHPDWTLDIYGEGSLKTSLEKLIADLRLEGAVCLQGKTQEIFKEMTNSSIFVLSSIYEGFGLVIVEAMSCGLPVVSYACPCGPKDIIEEGKDGFLVEVNDEQTLAARINQLIENEELRRQMSEAALQKSEKYKMERIIPMWMDLFEKLKREKG